MDFMPMILNGGAAFEYFLLSCQVRFFDKEDLAQQTSMKRPRNFAES